MSQVEEPKETAPEHHSVRILIATTDDAIIQVAKEVYWGEWTLAPSMLSCHQDNDCMRELGQDLSKHMARAGLQCATSLRRSSRSRRCSQGHSAFWTCLPFANHEPGRPPYGEEDSPAGWSESWKQHSQSKGQEQIKAVSKSLARKLKAILFVIP